MPQQLNQNIRNTFNKGLLTEFSELNFPNEASVDELNCSLFKAGNRSKRLGIEYETGYSLSSSTSTDGTLSGTSTWENVGKNADLEYLVVHVGTNLYFYKKGPPPLSGNVVPTSASNPAPLVISMSPFEKSGGLGSSASHIDVASIEGRLIVASPQINTFYIERDNTTEAFTATQISFKERDFEYLDDRISLTEEYTASITTQRRYDTKNCGWIGDKGAAALTTYVASESAWPALSHPWYSGKDASGNFSVSEWQKVYSGNTLIVNGHYILDVFNKDRAAASGLTALPVEVEADRFQAVASFAGRVFYGGVGSKIYFSRILEDFGDVGNCYQVNDPTSEEASDLLDTDGGFIVIPEAHGVKKLHPFGASLLVFADNGVWRITGVDNVFRASEYSVYKVTSNGLAVRKSLISGQNAVPYWWSYNGIHTIEVTEDNGLIERNISRDTIQTFWDNIEGGARSSVVGEYDELNDVVLWLYSNNSEAIEGKLNNILLLDVSLGAFYPWKVSDKVSSSPYILGTSFFSGKGATDIDFTVVDSDSDIVQDSLGNDVIITMSAGDITSSAVNFLVKDPTGAVTFAKFTDTTFYDWGDANYEAYAESSYNFIGDLGRRKNSPYITVFMRTTETGWVDNGDGTYSLIRPSSLKVSAYWDFKKTPSSSKQEAYRFKFPVTADPATLTFNYPHTVIDTRLKLRGSGHSVRVRFEGVEGKDFNLLGWETLDARNPSY